MASDDDATMIRLAQSDPTRFGALFDRHFDAVHRFCARRVGPDLADDLAGEVFRRAFEARQSYDISHPNALPWLFRIALNLVRDSVRSRAAEDRAYTQLLGLDRTRSRIDEDSASRSVAARDDLAHLASLLAAERREDVDALFMHVWEGLSYLEVATALGVPVGTVRSRLSRLRDRLEAALGSQAVEPQAPQLNARE